MTLWKLGNESNKASGRLPGSLVWLLMCAARKTDGTTGGGIYPHKTWKKGITWRSSLLKISYCDRAGTDMGADRTADGTNWERSDPVRPKCTTILNVFL